MRRTLPILTLCLLAVGVALVAPGCSSLQKGVDGTVAWLDQPAVAPTQPAKPGDPPPVTHEQVIVEATNTAGQLAGVGGVTALVVGAGLGILRSLSSKDHQSTRETVGQVLDIAQQTLNAVAPAVAPGPTAQAAASTGSIAAQAAPAAG